MVDPVAAWVAVTVGVAVGAVAELDASAGDGDALLVWDGLEAACSAVLGGCSDDQTANTDDEPATRTTPTAAMMMTIRREGVFTAVGTRISSDGYEAAISKAKVLPT